MFKSVLSSSQQISFTECDTGLPYRFAPMIFSLSATSSDYRLLFLLIRIIRESWWGTSTIASAFALRICSASFWTPLVITCSANSSHSPGVISLFWNVSKISFSFVCRVIRLVPSFSLESTSLVYLWHPSASCLLLLQLLFFGLLTLSAWIHRPFYCAMRFLHCSALRF